MPVSTTLELPSVKIVRYPLKEKETKLIKELDNLIKKRSSKNENQSQGNLFPLYLSGKNQIVDSSRCLSKKMKGKG